MGNEIILKKLNQIENLIKDLEVILSRPFTEFRSDKFLIGAAERYFQLLVDTASDINVQILVEKGFGTPDTYRQSFEKMTALRVLGRDLANSLWISARIRNILVHEYDFEEDYERFYNDAKYFLPLYRQYVQEVYHYIQSASGK